VRPNFDSIALPVAKWARDREAEREKSLRAEVEFFRAQQAQISARIDEFRAEINERVTRLESTEERGPLER